MMMRLRLPAHRGLRHLLFWVGMVLYLMIPQLVYPSYPVNIRLYFFDFDYPRSPYFLPLFLGYVLGVALLYTYTFLGWVMPAVLKGRYAAGIGRYILLTIGIGYGFRLLKALHVAVLDPWLRHQPIRSIDGRHFEGLFVDQVYSYEYTTIILLVAIYKLFVNWRHNQQEAVRLAGEKLRTQIQLMKSQVRPGFMVDNLDKLAALIENQNRQAPTVVLTLSGFLRYVLYESQADRVPLVWDLEAMQQYIQLERVRLGDRMDMSVSITGDIQGQFIAPLLFLPLLENAFRHGLTRTEPAWLSLNLNISGKTLRFNLANSVEPLDATAPATGLGLPTLLNRLNTLYPGHYEWTKKPEEGVFIVVLTIQLTESARIEPTPLSKPLTPDLRETSLSDH